MKEIKLDVQFLLPILFITFFINVFAFPQSPESNLPVNLEFEYPDRIMAGESFDLGISLKKVNNYNYPGNISLEFTGGMSPGVNSISVVDLMVQNNTMNLSWEELSASNIIQLPVSVKTEGHMGGVYPVRVKYTDLSGLSFNKNIGIYIQGTKKPEPYEPPLNENPFTISLVYPAEVYYDETYDLDIVIAKGKNTGGAKVFVQVPPGSDLFVDDYPDFHYRKEPGDLSILLNHMPASPEFKIHCQVTNSSKVTSVYPIRASVEFLNGNTISFDDFILVTNKKSNPGSYNSQSTLRSVNAVVNADTASLFEELDRLLTKWRESTGNYQRVPLKSRSETRTENPATESDFDSIFTEDVIFYSIQIAASGVTLNSIEQRLKDKGFNQKILEDYDGTIYRYSVGDFEDIDEAEALKRKLMEQGYPDAFIVEYINGVRSRSFY